MTKTIVKDTILVKDVYTDETKEIEGYEIIVNTDITFELKDERVTPKNEYK
jgi:hypothetical protein